MIGTWFYGRRNEIFMNRQINKKSGFSRPKIRFPLIDFSDYIFYVGFNTKTLFTFANDSQHHLILSANSPVLVSVVNFLSEKAKFVARRRRKATGLKQTAGLPEKVPGFFICS